MGEFWNRPNPVTAPRPRYKEARCIPRESPGSTAYARGRSAPVDEPVEPPDDEALAGGEIREPATGARPTKVERIRARYKRRHLAAGLPTAARKARAASARGGSARKRQE